MRSPAVWTHLQDLRRRARLTSTQLANEVGYSRVHIGEVERGVAGASEVLMGRLADFFKVDILELYRTRPTVPPRSVVRSVVRSCTRRRRGTPAPAEHIAS
ncbi:MAG: helix-turn-helix transcriptional regulator [Pseudonocardiaceae bacterium]